MHEFLKKLETAKPFIGHTPLKKLNLDRVDAYAKLEYTNLFGSVKDRAAYYILSEAIRLGQLTPENFIVESSSGNFAIALMGLCNLLGIKFVPVIDPNINEDYEKMLRLSCEVVKVTEQDETGGYLLTRLRTVKALLKKSRHAFWTDQYSNTNNYLSYYHTLAPEIGEAFDRLDYIFLAVSTAGTITGISRRIKEYFPGVKVVAVDIEGSLIFSDQPQKRYISGIGASKRSEHLQHAFIDDVVLVSHMEIIQGSRDLWNEQAIFAGASSGACYHALKNYFTNTHPSPRRPVAAFVCPDKGNAYLGNIYNDAWVEKIEALTSKTILTI